MGLLEKLIGREMAEELKKKDKPQKEKLNFEAEIKSEIEKDKKKEAVFGSIIFFGIGSVILLTLLYWFVYCPLSRKCGESASKIPSVPSEYECRQDPLSPECQDIYYSNPLH